MNLVFRHVNKPEISMLEIEINTSEWYCGIRRKLDYSSTFKIVHVSKAVQRHKREKYFKPKDDKTCRCCKCERNDAI